MIVGINSHAPGPDDDLFMEEATLWYVRTDFKQSYSDQTVRDMAQRFKERVLLSLLMEVTVDEPTPEAVIWNAVRSWQRCREVGVIPKGIELLNEPNLSNMGPWSRIPAQAGLAAVAGYEALRSDGYYGEIYSGSVSSLSKKSRIENFLGGYGGLDYLEAMNVKDWPSDMGVSVHRYPTVNDPKVPAPGNKSRDEEWARLQEIAGHRKIIVTELGAHTRGQSEQQAADALQYDLEYWSDKPVDVFVYTWAQKDKEHEVEFYGITTPSGPNERYYVVKAWNESQLEAA